MTPELEKWCETFKRAASFTDRIGVTEAGLSAILETHVRPLLAEAHAAGSSRYTGAPPFPADEAYAARIIRALTVTPP